MKISHGGKRVTYEDSDYKCLSIEEVLSNIREKYRPKIEQKQAIAIAGSDADTINRCPHGFGNKGNCGQCRPM